MTRYSTSKPQRSGYKFYIERNIQALTRRVTFLSASPQSLEANSRTAGIAGIVAVTLAGLAVGFISPPTTFDASHPYVISEDGTAYIYVNKHLHPVTNAASARLILGQAFSPKAVKDSAIKGVPKGGLIGLPSSPSTLTPDPETGAVWAVCSSTQAPDPTALATKTGATTTVLAGADALDAKAPGVTGQAALLVKSESGKVYVVQKGVRTEISPDDYSAQGSLGVSRTDIAGADQISNAALNTIPEQPILTLPFIKDKGAASSVGTYRVGDVLVTDSVDARAHYIVLDKGVQRVSPYVAQLFLSDSSRERVTVAPDELAKMVKVTTYDFSAYPDDKPTFTHAKAVCAKWEQTPGVTSPRVTVYAADTVPLSSEATGKVVALIPAKSGTAKANFAWSMPGVGHLVRVASSLDDTTNAGQLLWIDDTGVRFAIGGADDKELKAAVSSLGFSNAPVLPIPWSIAQLYAEGATLSRANALVVHENIAADNGQGVVKPEGEKK